MNSNHEHVLIAAGGTGGHIFPALAVAEQLRNQGILVSWIGNHDSMEERVVSGAGIPFYPIKVNRLRRSGIKNMLCFPVNLAGALWTTHRCIRKLKPSIILGMGGFVSGPAGLCALMHRIPLLIHEQNAIPGFTNRCLAHVASLVLESFPNTFGPSSKSKETISSTPPFSNRGIVCTGNPIRQQLMRVKPPTERIRGETRPLKLLILGGSQGARFINQLLPEAIAALSPDERPEIWHQTGPHDLATVSERYQTQGIPAQVSAFIEHMHEAYDFADIVVSRAGATTVAELCSVGLGSILIPLPHAVNDHQTANAAFLAKAGAAFLEIQADFTVERFTVIWRTLLADQSHLQLMANAAYGLRSEHASADIARLCLEINNKGKYHV